MPDLSVTNVSVDDVMPHPRNVRQGDVGAIMESLRVHGQYRPIVVQKETGYILAGNHTWKAAKSLGWSYIDVTYIDVNDDDALRILLVDNRTNDLSSYDKIGLVELLELLAATERSIEGTGFDLDDLDSLIGDVTKPLTVPDEFPEVDASLATEHQCPKCGYEWSGSTR